MEPGRETLEVDVLFVGAGPASLSGALHLRNLIERTIKTPTECPRTLGPVSIAIIEKGREIGAHSLSGAILDPVALVELLPDVDISTVPSAVPIREDHLCFLTSSRRILFPWLPASFRNSGNWIISLNRFVQWLGERAEECDIDLFPGFAGTQLLFEKGRVIGIRTGERGIDREGNRQPSYESGVDIHAKAVVLGEGVRGSLSRQLIREFRLDEGRNPQLYSLGIKELWEVPQNSQACGKVIHTLGFPLKTEDYGGGFIYHTGDRISLGLVVGLDYRNPYLDPHVEFQRFKTHPLVAAMLQGGKLLQSGAKALPEGGYFSVPKCHFPGGLLIGDTAGFLNSRRLKGIHLAMKSGMLAAETLYDALVKNDFSEATLGGYDQLFQQSWAGRELYEVRNFRQAFEPGLLAGLVHAGLQMAMGGREIRRRLENLPGHERMRTIQDYYSAKATPPPSLAPDGVLTFDKVTDLFYSGTKHEEDQPSHLLIADPAICHDRCTKEYGNPCQRFCPANVYEMVEGEEGRSKRLQVNPSNCFHCKTCDIMDPYQIITWVPPEGGGGPNFVNL